MIGIILLHLMPMWEVFLPNRSLQHRRVSFSGVLFCPQATTSLVQRLVKLLHIVGRSLKDCDIRNLCTSASSGGPFHSLSACAEPPAASTTSMQACVALVQASSAVLKSGAFKSILYDGAPS